ncbi:VWA domain-containing protein [uncultured Clostridium sp.]|uniref:VWA domain-containing protein n=1 Tax=uncultured Clostridium sp. TaxID=59620 RepID=UPI0032173351
MNFEIEKIYLLFLIPIILMTMYFISKKIKFKEKNVSFININRVIIVTMLILAMCNISISFRTKDSSTIFLLDLSHSMSNYKDETKAFVKNAIEASPSNNKIGIVTFGENQEIEQFLTYSKGFNDIQTSPIGNTTNIEEAIKFSLSIFKDSDYKRIVLVTDGKENQGDLLETSTYFRDNQVDFQVYKIDSEQVEDVYIEDIDILDKVAIGEEFSVTVNIKSNIKTKSKISIYSGREKKSEKEIDIEKGKNTFLFKDIQHKGGFKPYKVVIEPENDGISYNNEYTTYTNIVSKPEILVIQGKTGEGKGLEESLKAIGSSYTMINPSAAPRSINELIEYKGIFLCNTHIDDLPKGFLDNVESYVKDYGGAIITTGGDNSYALGGYKDSVFEDILPVSSDKKGKNEIPEISLTLVLDRSSSMLSSDQGSFSKISLAKEAAIRSLDNLRETDNIGVVTFNTWYSWVVPMQKLSNIEEVSDKINSIIAEGGTSIYSALNEAYQKQKESSAKIKHIILLTDGQDGMGQNEYKTLVNDIKKDKITLSTVSIGTDSNNQLLEWISANAGGRYYHSDIYTDVPRIFANEILISTGEYLINEEFTPKISAHHDILNNIIEEGKFPSLFGYVGTSIKNTAIEIMTSHMDEPVLAAWQYGVGRVVSFTSDVNGQWSKELLAFDKTPQLFSNIISWTMIDYDNSGNLSITQEGSSAKVQYETNNHEDNKKVKGAYTFEGNTTSEFELKEVSPGKYEGRVPMSELGFYSFNITEELQGNTIASQLGGFAYQYSPEYKFQEQSNSLLALVEDTEGKIINSVEDIYEIKSNKGYTKKNISNLLLIIAMLLFLFDITYRRLGLKKYVNKQSFINIKEKIYKKEECGKVDNVVKKYKADKPVLREAVENDLKNNNLDIKHKESKIKHRSSYKDRLNRSKSKDENRVLNTGELLKKKRERNED